MTELETLNKFASAHYSIHILHISAANHHYPSHQTPGKTKPSQNGEGFAYARPVLSVLMPVLAMHMLVSDFLSRCRAHVHHFDGKAQSFTA